jgi:uncharacterized protein DUF4388
VSVVIAGSFSEYPFSLLLEIFLLRGETGLLEVSSGEGSGYFYIKNGKVKDGQIGKSKGVAAVNVVRNFNDASFRFKPLDPNEYARVVWQRSFGPTAPGIVQLPVPAPAIGNKIRHEIRNKIGHLSIDPAALTRMLTNLGSLTQRAVRQLTLYTSTAYHSLQTTSRRIQAQLTAAQEKRRRDRLLRPVYPRKVNFQMPTIPTAAITSALQQGVEHNVIFAFTLTILLGVSGAMLYRLAIENRDPVETGFTIDEHFDVSPQNKRPTAKPKRQRTTRRATENSRPPKSPNNKPAEPSTQDSGVVPETSPIGAAPNS